MRVSKALVMLAAAVVGGGVALHAQRQWLNPVIALVEQGKPVFGAGRRRLQGARDGKESRLSNPEPLTSV